MYRLFAITIVAGTLLTVASLWFPPPGVWSGKDQAEDESLRARTWAQQSTPAADCRLG